MVLAAACCVVRVHCRTLAHPTAADVVPLGRRKVAAWFGSNDEFQVLELRLVERVVERLLVLEPETTAVLLTGSYAKGTATVASDLDLMAITPSPRFDYRTWFEEQETDPPLHISVGAETADAWLAEAKCPARWSLGFPATSRASGRRAERRTNPIAGRF